MSKVILIVALLFVGLIVAMQVLIRARARAMRGKDLPAVPGPLGRQLARAPRSLLYFFSPSCAACKPLTPRFLALRRSNGAVHLIDVAQDLSVARAFSILATPCVVEVEGGKIAGYHVGAVPSEVLARFA